VLFGLDLQGFRRQTSKKIEEIEPELIIVGSKLTNSSNKEQNRASSSTKLALTTITLPEQARFSPQAVDPQDSDLEALLLR